MDNKRLRSTTHTYTLAHIQLQPNLVESRAEQRRFHACFAPRITCQFPLPTYHFSPLTCQFPVPSCHFPPLSSSKLSLVVLPSAVWSWLICAVVHSSQKASQMFAAWRLWSRSWHWAFDISIRPKTWPKIATLFFAVAPKAHSSNSNPNFISNFNSNSKFSSSPVAHSSFRWGIIIKCSSIHLPCIARIVGQPNAQRHSFGALWLWNAAQSHQNRTETTQICDCWPGFNFSSTSVSFPVYVPVSQSPTASLNAGAVLRPQKERCKLIECLGTAPIFHHHRSNWWSCPGFVSASHSLVAPYEAIPIVYPIKSDLKGLYIAV